MNRAGSPRVLVVLLAMAALGVAAIGCGGSDSDSLTRAEFKEQANAICARAEKTKNAKLTAAFKELNADGGAASKSAQEKIVLQALAPITQMVEELEDLSPPSEDQDQVAEIVSSFKVTITKVEDDPGSALEPGSEPFEEAGRMAAQYGLDSCRGV